MTSRPIRNITAAFAYALSMLLVISVFGAREARADRVKDLSRTLLESKREKARISAAVALGRLHDKRGVKPLVFALRKDRSRLVRAVAAAALGHIGDQRALPALRKAKKDKDKSVRKRAAEAVQRIESRNDGRKVASGKMNASQQVANARRFRMAARERPRVGVEPKLYVQIKSVADKSKRRASKKSRAWAAQNYRTFMHRELRGTPEVTMDEEHAQDDGLRMFEVDVTITRFSRRVRGPWVEIECEVRVAVSNGRGRMLSFLTGGAAVQVPKGSFKRKYEGALRKEALENAAKSMHGDLMAYLAKETRL